MWVPYTCCLHTATADSSSEVKDSLDGCPRWDVDKGV